MIPTFLQILQLKTVDFEHVGGSNWSKSTVFTKSVVFIKICSFWKKICDFHQNPRFLVKSSFLPEISTGKHLWPNERPLAEDGNPIFATFPEYTATKPPNIKVAAVKNPHNLQLIFVYYSQLFLLCVL